MDISTLDDDILACVLQYLPLDLCRIIYPKNSPYQHLLERRIFENIRFGGLHTENAYSVTLDELTVLAGKEIVPSCLEIRFPSMLMSDQFHFIEFARNHSAFLSKIGKVSLSTFTNGYTSLADACPGIFDNISELLCGGELDLWPQAFKKLRKLVCSHPIDMPDTVVELNIRIFEEWFPDFRWPASLELLTLSNAKGDWWNTTLPSSLRTLRLDYCEGIEEASSSLSVLSKLQTFHVRTTTPFVNPQTVMDNLPSSVEELLLEDSIIQPVRFPVNVKKLNLQRISLSSLEGFLLPAGLVSMDLSLSHLTSLGELPLSLEFLDISYSWLLEISQVTLPKLKSLHANETSIKDWNRFEWTNLEVLALNFQEDVQQLFLPATLKKLEIKFKNGEDFSSLVLPKSLQILHAFEVKMKKEWDAPPLLTECLLQGELKKSYFGSKIVNLIWQPDNNDWFETRFPDTIFQLTLEKPFESYGFKGRYPKYLQDLRFVVFPSDVSSVALPNTLQLLVFTRDYAKALEYINGKDLKLPENLQLLHCDLEDHPNLPPTLRVYGNYFTDGDTYERDYTVPLSLID